MRTIYKYELVHGPQLLRLPRDSRILHADMQNGGLFLWALVNTTHPEEGRQIIVTGTGHEIKENPVTQNLIHISTIMDDVYVWHVFEVTPKQVPFEFIVPAAPEGLPKIGDPYPHSQAELEEQSETEGYGRGGG